MKRTDISPMLLLLPILALVACSDETFNDNDGPVPSSGARIRLQADIDQVNVTRADDSGFADGDKIGIYAVAFGADGNPGELQPEVNLVTNLGFTYKAQTNTW
ncbi:MAG: fimbrillin family protein, partial [Muribaculaceae bacterium]|nr:fimbrillin family protein [Muribaculaceae bacterium]